MPDTIAPRVVPGARVQVPLGRSKVYTGVVLRTTATKPDFDVREVMAAPDDGAVLLPIQLRLWQ